METLKRQIGFFGALAIGVGGTVGGGIYVLVGTAASRAGPAALVSFAIAFVAAICIALPYAELACRYPDAGGAYAFTKHVFGKRWAQVSGWNYWGAYIFVSAYVTIGFGGYLNALTGFPRLYSSLLLVLIITAINVIGIKTSGRIQMILLAIALGTLLIYLVDGILHAHPQNLVPFMPNGIGGVLSASLVAFLAFGGFDMVASAGEEVTDPERNLPRAIIATLLIVLVLYISVTLAAITTFSWRGLGSSYSPLTSSAATFMGVYGVYLITIAAVVTTAATASAVLVVTSRVSYAMARDSLLPSLLSATMGKEKSPYAAVLLNGILIGLISLTGSIDLAVAIGGFLYTMHFMFPLLSITKIKLCERKVSGIRKPAFQIPLPQVLIPAAFVLSAILIISSGLLGIVLGSLWLLSGVLMGRMIGLKNPTNPEVPQL